MTVATLGLGAGQHHGVVNAVELAGKMRWLIALQHSGDDLQAFLEAKDLT